MTLKPELSRQERNSYLKRMMIRRANSRSSGFTFIELIAGIVLVAIISSAVSSRWFFDESYRVNSAASQLVSVSRLAQKISLSHGGVDIHLVISQLVDGWQYRILEDDAGTITTLHQFNIDAENVNVSVTAGIGPSSLATGTDLDVEFDGLGNVSDIFVGATQGAVANGIAILLSDSIHFPICISPLGFAHVGDCI